jgi:hypothetical protein
MELPLDVKLFINATGSTLALLIAIIISDGREEDDGGGCDARELDSGSAALAVAGITKLVNRCDIKLSVSSGDISLKILGNEQIPLVNEVFLRVVDDDVAVSSCSCLGIGAL